MRIYTIYIRTKIATKIYLDKITVEASTPTVAHCIAMKQVDAEYRGYKIASCFVYKTQVIF